MTLSEIKNTYLIYCLHSALSTPVDVTEKEKKQNKTKLTHKRKKFSNKWLRYIWLSLSDGRSALTQQHFRPPARKKTHGLQRSKPTGRQRLDSGQVSTHSVPHTHTCTLTFLSSLSSLLPAVGRRNMDPRLSAAGVPLSFSLWVCVWATYQPLSGGLRRDERKEGRMSGVESRATGMKLSSTYTGSRSSNLPGLPEHSRSNSYHTKCNTDFWSAHIVMTLRYLKVHTVTKLAHTHSSEGSKVMSELHRLIYPYMKVMHKFIEPHPIWPPHLSKLVWWVCIL